MKLARVDYILLISILVLTTFGIVVIYSSSSHYAMLKFGSASQLVEGHLKKAVVGVVVLFVAMNFKPKTWKKLARPIFLIGLLFCLIVLFKFSALTLTAKGATRWISIFGISFQPSEIIKIGLILVLAKTLEQNQEWISDFKRGFLPPMILLIFVFGILLKQPSYSMCLMISGITLCMVFVAGCNFKHIFIFIASCLPIFVTIAMWTPYRRARINAMLDPTQNVDSGYQQTAALASLSKGGFNGVGLGEGTQKLGWLPEPFTDSIYATIGEELGFIGTSLIMIVFAIIIWRGLLISFHSQDVFSRLLALGITMGIAMNVLLHVAVCLRVIPPTGQPLPLISHGGTNLIMTLGAMGILLSLSRNDDYPAINTEGRLT